ncbi:hypothetical protein Agub_g14275 [Astrephomene gubernaculifera]|uniref:Uncharacterized protein n=1 Tax=Astrephomene gubernaculifera TaxID=47775 RepID=A0AAD3HTA8_9CHLO|nr:hypothetical protein Agub_g14275 [Astrephomene gubernaculifera]
MARCRMCFFAVVCVIAIHHGWLQAAPMNSLMTEMLLRDVRKEGLSGHLHRMLEDHIEQKPRPHEQAGSDNCAPASLTLTSDCRASQAPKSSLPTTSHKKEGVSGPTCSGSNCLVAPMPGALSTPKSDITGSSGQRVPQQKLTSFGPMTERAYGRLMQRKRAAAMKAKVLGDPDRHHHGFGESGIPLPAPHSTSSSAITSSTKPAASISSDNGGLSSAAPVETPAADPNMPTTPSSGSSSSSSNNVLSRLQAPPLTPQPRTGGTAATATDTVAATATTATKQPHQKQLRATEAAHMGSSKGNKVANAANKGAKQPQEVRTAMEALLARKQEAAATSGSHAVHNADAGITVSSSRPAGHRSPNQPSSTVAIADEPASQHPQHPRGHRHSEIERLLLLGDAKPAAMPANEAVLRNDARGNGAVQPRPTAGSQGSGQPSSSLSQRGRSSASADKTAATAEQQRVSNGGRNSNRSSNRNSGSGSRKAWGVVDFACVLLALLLLGAAVFTAVAVIEDLTEGGSNTRASTSGGRRSSSKSLDGTPLLLHWLNLTRRLWRRCRRAFVFARTQLTGHTSHLPTSANEGTGAVAVACAFVRHFWIHLWSRRGRTASSCSNYSTLSEGGYGNDERLSYSAVAADASMSYNGCCSVVSTPTMASSATATAAAAGASAFSPRSPFAAPLSPFYRGSAGAAVSRSSGGAGGSSGFFTADPMMLFGGGEAGQLQQKHQQVVTMMAPEDSLACSTAVADVYVRRRH